MITGIIEKKEIVQTAEGMYRYCIENEYGIGMTESWGIKHFKIIENALFKDEKVLVAFIGLHNYQSPTKHDNNFGYVVTNKRMIIAQKKLIGEVLQTISLDNINDITLATGFIFGTITVDTIKETFNVAVNKKHAKLISEELHNILDRVNKISKNEQSTFSVTDEILKLKQMLDSNIITKEEFDKLKSDVIGN